MVHGTHDTVNRILDHPDIKAVSFVGGDKAARYIYERASHNGKRVQVQCRTLCCLGLLGSCFVHVSARRPAVKHCLQVQHCLAAGPCSCGLVLWCWHVEC